MLEIVPDHVVQIVMMDVLIIVLAVVVHVQEAVHLVMVVQAA